MLATVYRLALTSLQLRGYTSRFVSTSVGDIHLIEGRGAGSLPPVILLHGLSSAAVHFAQLLDALRPRVSCLWAPDLLAHGLSDVPAVGPSGEALKVALIETLDAVIDEPVIVFGNSMGGLAAIRYAQARPGQVLGMVLCSPGGAPVDAAGLSHFTGRFRLDNHAAGLEFVGRLFARPPVLRHIYAWGVRKSLGRAPIQTLLSAITPQDLLDAGDLRALSVPVLLIWGQGDRVLPRAHFDFFVDNLPTATVLRPRNVGHSPYLEDPKGLAQAIATFAAEVKRLRRAS